MRLRETLAKSCFGDIAFPVFLLTFGLLEHAYKHGAAVGLVSAYVHIILSVRQDVLTASLLLTRGGRAESTVTYSEIEYTKSILIALLAPGVLVFTPSNSQLTQ
jgi:hypothetical protein